MVACWASDHNKASGLLEIQNKQIVDLNTYAAKYFNEKDDIVDNLHSYTVCYPF